MKFATRLIMVASAIFSANTGFAAESVAFDNILMSKTNGIATVQIWPACPMDYVEHLPDGAGIELRIRVDTDGECADLLQEVTTEAYRPLGGRLGNLTGVTFDAISPSETYITLNFSKPSQFEIRQHPVGWIEVMVDTNIDSAILPAAAPPPLRVEPEPVAPTPMPALVYETQPRKAAPPMSVRPQQQSRPVEPSQEGQFVVQLGVFDSVDAAITELLRTGTRHFAYTTEFDLNGRTWHGLQVGFFENEMTAERVLAELDATFPDSWVRYVNPNEASEARSRGELRASASNKVPAVLVERLDSDSAQIGAWMADGRQALLDRRYDDAIQSYTRVLEYGDHEHRSQAREFIAVAHERSGQTANALAEYQAFLDEFPGGDDADRVRARLASLDTGNTASVPQMAIERPADADGWEVYGGVSQYYWRNEEQLVHDGNRLVSGSGVLALGDFTASRRGSRFDILARANGGYQFNLVEYDSAGDTGWLSSAFVDVVDNHLGLQAKVGRQTRRSDGVPDRFDGAALSYQWRPNITVGVSAGLPIDSPRFVSGGERAFYAFSAQVADIWDKLTVNAYTHQQTVDGISDRQAVGGELRFRDGPLNVIGLVDYDASYNVLNTLLVNSTWRFENDWQVNGMVRFGAQPYLTTRNALAGQTAISIEEMLDTYTEGQIRTLARDRTAQSTTASVGLSVPLSERLDVRFDVTTRQAEATVASGGVAAIPATGSQLYINARLVGSSILKQGDLTMLTLRHDTTRTRDSSMVLVDSRLPIGERLRFNPRISVTQRTDNSTGMEQIIAAPSIRVLYRWKRLMIDLEGGGRWASRELPPEEWDPFTPDGTEVLTGGFVNLGYRLEF